MNEVNMIRRLSYLVPGDGYRKCAPLNILADVKTTAGLVLTGATVPAIAALETNFNGLQIVQGQTALGCIKWIVPDDYDSSIDEFRIRVAANRNGNTTNGTGNPATDDAAKTLGVVIYRKRPVPSIIPDDAQGKLPAGLALTADLGIVSVSPVIPGLGTGATTNTLTTWLEINADIKTGTIDPALGSPLSTANRSLSATADASLKPGDCLDIDINLNSATGTDAINVYGIEFWYRSNLAFTDINSR